MVHIKETARAEFAARLRQAISERGWQEYGSGSRLARLVGVSPKAASKWLGAEAIPSHEKIAHIANALGVAPAWLEYGEEGQKDKEPTPSGEVPLISKADITAFLDGKEVETTPAPAMLSMIKQHTKASPRTFAYTEDIATIPWRITAGKSVALVDPAMKVTTTGPATAYLVNFDGTHLVGSVDRIPSGMILTFGMTGPGWEPKPFNESQLIGKVIAFFDPETNGL